jgi:hypothetical protein
MCVVLIFRLHSLARTHAHKHTHMHTDMHVQSLTCPEMNVF